MDQKKTNAEKLDHSVESESRAFRAAIGAPDMSDNEWTEYIKTGIIPETSTLKYKAEHFNPENKGEVLGLQRSLHSAGYYDGDLDGIFGIKSEKALRVYQKDRDRTMWDIITNIIGQ